MNLKNLLQKYKNGEIGIDDTQACIRSLGYVPVCDVANIDTFRKHRTGIMEAVLADGKTPEDILEIAKAQIESTGRVLITRLNEDQASCLENEFGCERIDWGIHHRTAAVHDGTPIGKTGGVVAIISAGTADINVAEEARMTAAEMGCETVKIYDVGVAGLHRLLNEVKNLESDRPDAVVVAAGREGTLPTVVSSLFDVPVIGLPVSTGYGIGAKGEAALYSMLQSCSVLSVVNIDAGFVAGAFAGRIANTVAAAREQTDSVVIENQQGRSS